jgi:hypothetical protein
MRKSSILLIIYFIFSGIFGSAVCVFGTSGETDWVNLQWPPQANIAEGGTFNIYARCYEAGMTDPAGADDRISVWIGYNTENVNPNTWNNWILATFNNQFGSSDEYMISLGNTLPAGIYYYASRIQIDGGNYRYGGYNAGGGGFWDGKVNVSGALTAGKPLAEIILGNMLQLYDGNPKNITATTNPSGLTVKITYDGTENLPVYPGTYQVGATIDDPGFQGSQTGTLSIYEVAQDEVSEEFRHRFIWVMYDQVYNQDDLDIAMSFKPDVISRGWFKWGNWGNFDYNQWSWMVDQSAEQNTIFGGGGTVQALYPDEADEAKILRMVERTPLNKPMFFAGDTTIGYYNGDIQKKEYLDFLLAWLYRQIDAGARTLHLDGIAAVPAVNTGYSDYSMGEFNKFLIHKYCDGYGWSLDDARWQYTFGISMELDCTDGTLNTFDYRRFLIRNGYEKDPMSYNFDLRREFGDPWNYLGTYLDQRNQQACEYLYTSLKNYSETRGKKVTITTNGFSNYVDYQTMGVWDSWKLDGGRLNITPSYITHWRDIKEYSMKYLNRDVPLIVFHDWGYGMPFLGEVPPEDQILWLRVYAPEVFASGAVFAWPVSGGGNLYKPTMAVQDTVMSLVKWYDKNRDLFINSYWNGDSILNLNGLNGIVKTVSDQYTVQKDVARRIIHLINKNLDSNRNLVSKSNFSIKAASSTHPLSVWAASPDFTGYQKLDFTFAEGTVNIAVKSLQAYTVVVLDYQSEVVPSNIQQSRGEDPEIWPNPCYDVLKINNFSRGSGRVQVLDMLGKTCFSGIIENGELDVRALQPGIYILKTGKSVCRFVKH